MTDDFDDELREIKREIVESRGLIIKTNNLTNALAADLKSISKRQIGFERRAFWNSASANLLFVVVVIGVVKLAWDARVDAVQGETRGARDKLGRMETEIKEMQRKNDERVRAESAAAAFYELVRAERRQEIIEGFENLRKEPLTRAELAFFSDAVDEARGELSIKSYHTGLDHSRAGRKTRCDRRTTPRTRPRRASTWRARTASSTASATRSRSWSSSPRRHPTRRSWTTRPSCSPRA
jgi:hypothetical protein